MAQQEHDARNADEQKPLNPTPVDDPAATPDNKAEAQENIQERVLQEPAESVEEEVKHLDLANDDGTDQNETDTLVSEIGPTSEDMESTPTLNAMEDETPLAISGTVDEDPVLLGKAYELAEAIADQAPQGTLDSSKEEASSDEITEAAAGETEEPQKVMAGASETQESQPIAESAEPGGSPDQDDRGEDEEVLEASSDDEEDDSDESEEIEYSQLSPTELVAVLEKELEELSVPTVSVARFRKADAVVKEVRPVLDQLKRNAWNTAKEKYVADTGSEDGFEYKHDETTRRLEEFMKEIRSKRKDFFHKLEKSKDQNFNQKTELLQRLRELVDTDDTHETGAADIKSSWEEFKKIQEEWKQAGNVSSAHNGTLWATYNALIDRYFSNRNIYFELKELDRKRNAELKVELCEKIENLVKTLDNRPMTREILAEGNQIFEEYKHVGPAPREEQEVLWQRFKKSLDTLYDARRAQHDDQKKGMVEVYEQKSKIYETIVPYTTFSSGSINEWNTKSKEIIAHQEAWVATKGPMPREEGKQLSKKFWAALKTFFSNKGEFFKQLESKRDANLKAKTELCEQVELIVASGEDTPANTQRIIELQKQWKGIGQVPEKFKNSIYTRFKQSCDAYFEQKRSKNKEQDKDFEDNLAQKKKLIERIEKAAADPKDSTLSHLNEFKEEWAKIGFVPRKEMQTIQKRYIAAINDYVSAIGKLTTKEKEQVVLESEVEMVKEGDSSRNLYRKESDIRRKVTQLENDISLWQNNIEFFAKSKSADKLKAQFEEKIRKASEQLNDLKHQLTIIQEAI
jgi:hypothetical protein